PDGYARWRTHRVSSDGAIHMQLVTINERIPAFHYGIFVSFDSRCRFCDLSYFRLFASITGEFFPSLVANIDVPSALYAIPSPCFRSPISTISGFCFHISSKFVVFSGSVNSYAPV